MSEHAGRVIVVPRPADRYLIQIFDGPMSNDEARDACRSAACAWSEAGQTAELLRHGGGSTSGGRGDTWSVPCGKWAGEVAETAEALLAATVVGALTPGPMAHHLHDETAFQLAVCEGRFVEIMVRNSVCRAYHEMLHALRQGGDGP